MIDQLQAKIFSPHLISNNTVLNFQEFEEDGHLVSLIDIFRVFDEHNKQNAKFYFKFDPEEYQNQLNAGKIQTQLQQEQSVFGAQNAEGESNKHRRIRGKETEYFQFEMKRFRVLVDGKNETILMVFSQSLSTVLKQQQKKSDEMYQEAIEANYSHEQMTPLNSILGNSGIILEDL